MRGLRCSQGVDLDVVKDLMESGAWSMRLNDDLMAQLCPALVSTWRAFVAAHDARAPWQVWLCAMLQFLENEEAAELERAEAGRDVVAAERALFEGRPTPITDRLLLAALLTLHHEGRVSLVDLVRAVTLKPAQLLGLDAGGVSPGSPADLVVCDSNAPLVVDADKLISKSKNSPFDGRRLQGKVLLTMVGGRMAYRAA